MCPFIEILFALNLYAREILLLRDRPCRTISAEAPSNRVYVVANRRARRYGVPSAMFVISRLGLNQLK